MTEEQISPDQEKQRGSGKGKTKRGNWPSRFVAAFVVFYGLLFLAVAYGLFVVGIEKVEPKILLFVLIGLILAPLLANQLPLLKGFKAFGMEIELQEKVKENTQYITDLDKRVDDRILKLLADSVDEKSLSESGRQKMQKWKDKEERQ